MLLSFLAEARRFGPAARHATPSWPATALRTNG
jgi:hypothetical protein